MKQLTTIGKLFTANIFMSFTWYCNLRFKEFTRIAKLGLFLIVLISWGIAQFEYLLLVPANRLRFTGNGYPFSLIELKILQEVITLIVFVVFSPLVFKNETFKLNHLIGFVFLILAVYLIFKK